MNNAATDIMQIRDETQTKIDLPAESEEKDTITITGKKENIEEARERIQKIQNELVSNVSLILKDEPYRIYLHNLCTF